MSSIASFWYLSNHRPKALAKINFTPYNGRLLCGWVAQLVEQRIENPRVGGSIPSPATTQVFIENNGWVAQLVEQRIENPRVGGSIPSPATTSSESR